MANNKQGLLIARKLCRVQLVVLLATATFVLLISGINAATSMILGGLINILPNEVFARILFKENGAQAAKNIARNFYRGEAVKLLLTICLFALVFNYLHVVASIFFAGFILAQMMHWFVPLLVNNKQK